MSKSNYLAALLFSSAACAAYGGSYHPATEESIPSRLLWGDTHLHTSLSADAASMGNVQLGPADAYRFARGRQVETPVGPARLSRPLDFLVVSDHAEYLGLVPWALEEPETRDPGRFSLQFFHALMQGPDTPPVEGVPVEDVRASSWRDSLAAAEAANDPGNFTALLGYEWSSMPGGDNLHRVVVFRDGAGRVASHLPFSALDSGDPEDLWRALDTYEAETGGRAIAIPHNGNVSNGRMFARQRLNGEPIDAAYARTRARFEPVVEVTQIKGDGETHPLLSPGDPFADFGTWDKGNLGGTARKTQEMLQFEYARSSLGVGLSLARRIGINPYAFGMIGASDAHTSLATADDDNYWGKSAADLPGMERRTERRFQIFPGPGNSVAAHEWDSYEPGPTDLVVHNWEQLASGYAAVWARDNTRAAIFDALERREVYASTGPRITLRVFAGRGFNADDLARPDWVREGYRRGVPMGGTLAGKDPRPPTLMMVAMKDPEGANLDQLQVIKGWLDSDGNLSEKVYPVAWSGARTPDREGHLPPVGNTVDLTEASYRNTIGAPRLEAVWEDPDFTPGQHAFYYLRVLEIPTPRWIAYDEARLDVRFAEDARRVDQQRAYSSPIWVQP